MPLFPNAFFQNTVCFLACLIKLSQLYRFTSNYGMSMIN